MHEETTIGQRVRLAVLVFCAVATCTLTGCFDLLQEIWVAPDGSARMVLDVSLPKGVLQLAGRDPFIKMREDAKKTEEDLKKDPSVKKFEFRDYEEGDVHHLVYELEVTDATKLGDLQKRATADAAKDAKKGPGDSMTFHFEKGAGGKLLFVQRLGKGGAAGADAGAEESGADQAAKQFGKQMAMAMFAGHYVTVRVHGPAIADTNGTLNDKKDTAEWKIPVAELMSEDAPPHELRAEINVGAPIWVWGLFIGVPALLLMLAIAAMKRRRATPVVG